MEIPALMIVDSDQHEDFVKSICHQITFFLGTCSMSALFDSYPSFYFQVQRSANLKTRFLVSRPVYGCRPGQFVG